MRERGALGYGKEKKNGWNINYERARELRKKKNSWERDLRDLSGDRGRETCWLIGHYGNWIYIYIYIYLMLAEHCTRKNHHEGDQLQYIAVVMLLGRKPTRSSLFRTTTEGSPCRFKYLTAIRIEK